MSQMSWHYQIRRSVYKGHELFEIVEVHEKPNGWTDAIHPCGETREELIEDLKRMLADAEKYPVFSVVEGIE